MGKVPLLGQPSTLRRLGPAPPVLRFDQPDRTSRGPSGSSRRSLCVICYIISLVDNDIV
jgi:hypothetical protein